MDNDKTVAVTPGEELPPFHAASLGLPYSRVEVFESGGHIRYDPETAHKAIGDSGYQRRIPESCGLCQAKEIAEEAAEALQAEMNDDE